MLDGLPASTLVALYTRAAIAEAALRTRLLVHGLDGSRDASSGPDRILGVEAAAEALGMSTDFLYRRWSKLGVGYKDVDGRVKFPLSKIARYIRARAGR